MGRPSLFQSLVLLLAPLGWSQPSEWYVQPVFPLAALDLKQVDVKPLLSAACPGRVHAPIGKTDDKFGCTLCPAGSDFHFQGDDVQSLQSVTFGHFISPYSDDALLSMVGCESHSNYFGGSFLLTRQSGKWKLIGYYQRLVTEQCHGLETQSGRTILVCSYYFGAQGFMTRFLYALDFGLTPNPPRVTPLLTVSNGLYSCGQAGEEGNKPIQQSIIESVRFLGGSDGAPAVAIVARTGLIQRTDQQFQACERWVRGTEWKDAPPVRTPAYRIDYLLKGDRLVLAPQSAQAMRHFPDSDVF